MSQAVCALVLRAHSGVHAGTGQEVGAVDLPIQRERITQFPVVRSSSLKGALRQAGLERGLDEKTDLAWMFGPDTRDAPDHAGAVSVGDARLLLFPMRSLKGTFALVTCPFALRRLKRDLDDAGLTLAGGKSLLTATPDLPPNSVKVQLSGTASWVKLESTTAAVGGTKKIQQMVVLEDHGLEVAPSDEVDKLAGELKILGLDENELKGRLVVVGDDLFQNFVSFCTEVVTRVHLEDATKTVKAGQLWTEELLPAESVLVSVLLSSASRAEVKNGGGKKSGADLLGGLRKAIGNRLQIGGNETVGYGVCHASWLEPKDLPAPGKKEK